MREVFVIWYVMNKNPPPVFKNTFPFVHNPSFNLVTQKLQKHIMLSTETNVVFEGFWRPSQNDFWAARDMVGNIMMSFYTMESSRTANAFSKPLKN
jgi:hypothetical protein